MSCHMSYSTSTSNCLAASGLSKGWAFGCSTALKMMLSLSLKSFINGSRSKSWPPVTTRTLVLPEEVDGWSAAKKLSGRAKMRRIGRATKKRLLFMIYVVPNLAKRLQPIPSSISLKLGAGRKRLFGVIVIGWFTNNTNGNHFDRCWQGHRERTAGFVSEPPALGCRRCRIVGELANLFPRPAFL